MMSQYKAHLKLILTILLCITAVGCATLGPTKPNNPYQGPYPESLQILLHENELLVKELAKLPEIQDGISNNEASALNRIVKVYKDNPDRFNAAFNQMYQVGMPEVRKHCSPLQALFWYAQDGKLSIQDNLLIDYSLKKLLESTWNIGASKPQLSEEEVLEAINGIKDQNQKRQFLQYIENGIDEVTINTIYVTWKNYPKKFSRKSRRIIAESMNKDPRWNEFDKVIERLNDPQLIDYYEKKALRWIYYRTLPYYLHRPVSPKYVFKHKKGCCRAFSDFTVYCLRRAGYSAEKHLVEAPPGASTDLHWVCLFEMNGKKYVMDNGRPDPKGIFLFNS